jgi:hypothetical protein
MRGLLLALLAGLAGVSLAGCAGEVRPEDVEVPEGLAVSDAVYRAAYVHGANRVGPYHFERLYEVNRTLSGPARLTTCDPDPCRVPLARFAHDVVVFDLVAPGIREPAAAQIPVWPNGTVALDEQPYLGLPDCRARSASCLFNVDADEARAVGEADGLRERGCPLSASLGWWAELERFAWHVDDQPCPESNVTVHVVAVDAATGRVVARSDHSTPDDSTID